MTDVFVEYHLLLVADPGADLPFDRPEGGLAVGGLGGAVIFAGLHTGFVSVAVDLAESEPPADTQEWEQTDEVYFVTRMGETRVADICVTPQGPGRYGMRVHARGDHYLVVVWPLELGPDVEAPAPPRGLAAQIREWSRIHADPSMEPGRIARTADE